MNTHALALSCLVYSAILFIAACREPPASPRPPQPPSGSKTTAMALPRRPLRVVHSLLDNRLLAHWSIGGGLLIKGDHGLAKYTAYGRFAGGWHLAPGAKRAGVLPQRRVTRIALPRSLPTVGHSAKGSALTLRLRLPAPTTITVGVASERLPSRALGEGTRRLTIPLPPGAWRAAGPRRLTIDWGAKSVKGRALSWLHIGSPLAGDVALPRFHQQTIVLPTGTGVSWLLRPPAAAQLSILARGHGKGRLGLGRCRLRVRVSSAQQTVERELTRSLYRTKDRIEKAARVDLAAVAGRVARVTFAARGVDCGRVVIARAEIGVGATKAKGDDGPRAAAASPTAKRSGPSRPKNVLLWVIDTARADHYRLYDKRSRVQTPTLAELAAGGALFRNAYSAGSESMTGYGALWTGAYPRQNGQLGFAWRRRLPRPWTTLSKALSKAGLATGCFTANGFVSARIGYAAGCDVFHNAIHDKGGTSAEALVRRALSFVEARRGEPFFLYLGTIDPHVTLRAHEPWISRYHPEPYKGPFEKRLPGLVAARFKEAVYERRGATPLSRPVGARNRKRIIAIYDSTISYNDAQLGRLLSGLKKLGLAKETLIVVTADHGEELWDEGGFGHSHSLRDYVTRVPLIVHYPPLFRGGVIADVAVSGVDVMPTILEALGKKVPDNVQGRGLARWIPGGAGDGRVRGVLLSRYGADWGLRLSRYKLIAMRDKPAVLYEIDGVVEKRSDDALARRWLTDVLSLAVVYQRRWRGARWGDLANHDPRLARDLEEGTAPEKLGPDDVLPPKRFR